MKKIATLVTLLIVFQFSFAQQNRFSKIYFDNIHDFSAEAIVKSFDGGLIVAGLHYYSSAVFKIDSMGAIVWAKKFGAFLGENVNAIVRTQDSCYVMAGKINDTISGFQDIQITKFDKSGNLNWSKVILLPEMQEAYSLSSTTDNGFILSGYECSVTPPYCRILVSKLDSTGEVQWLKTYEYDSFSCVAYSIKQTPDGGFALVGTVDNSISSSGILLKLSPNGNVEWTNLYNTTVQSVFNGKDLILTNDGIFSYHSSEVDLVLIKTDFNGIDFWDETITGAITSYTTFNVITPKIKLLSDGNLILATHDRGMPSRSSIVCLDSSGSINWCQNIDNSVHDVEEADDHGYYILGNGPSATSTPPYYDFVGIVKTDSLGNADFCTSINPSISLSLGNVIKSSISLNVYTLPAVSTLLLPVVSDFFMLEMNACGDNISGIEEKVLQSIEIFPNPSGSNMNFRISGIIGNTCLQISDLLGKIVYVNNYNIDSNYLIEIDHQLPSGLYNVSVSSIDKKIVAKFVVE